MEENLEMDLSPETEQQEQETPAEAPEQQEEPQEQQEETAEESFELEQDGEVKKLSREEVLALAKKGMGYDTIKAEHDRLADSEAVKLMDRLAKAANQTPDEYMKTVTARLAKADETRLKKEIMERYGVNEKTALELVKQEQEREKERETQESLKSELNALKARQAAQDIWVAFIKAHPEVTSYDALPEEVRLQVKAGKELEDAYNAYEVKQLRDRMDREARQTKNKEKAPGSTKDAGSAGNDADDFLKGFLGDY